MENEPLKIIAMILVAMMILFLLIGFAIFDIYARVENLEAIILVIT